MVNLSLNELKTIANIRGINPNKAGKFEVSFFWGRGQFAPPPPVLHILRKTSLISI